jgi:hypothetical protein
MRNLPAHVDHFRGGNVVSFDREQRRADATDAAVMAKVMGKAAPDTAPGQPNADPERDAVIARLTQEGRSEREIAAHMGGYDEATRRTESFEATLRGSQEGKRAVLDKQFEIEKKDAEEKRSDSRDQEAMARAMRSAGSPESLIKPVAHVAPRTAVSASDRARLANEQRMRTAWHPPAPGSAPETRQDEAREQRPPSTQSGPRVSASERAKRQNEERLQNAWRR